MRVLTERRRGRRRSVSLFSILLTVLCLVLFGGPLVMMISNAFRSGVPGRYTGWSLDGFRAIYENPAVAQSLINSFIYGILVATISTVAAVYFAWLFSRSNVPLRQILPLVMMMIVATPPLFFAISYDALGSARIGLLNDIIRSVLNLDMESGPIDIRSWPGMVWVASIKATAFGFMLMLPAFLRVDRTLEEAARVSGASRFEILSKTLVPVLAPSIGGAFVLAFAYTIESFEIPFVIGYTVNIEVLSTQIYRLLNNGPDYMTSSAIALPVMLLILALVWFRSRRLGSKQFVTVTGKTFNASPNDFGRARIPHAVAIGAFAIVALILPALQIVLQSLQVRPGRYDAFTLDAYQRFFGSEDLMSAFANTGLLAVLGGLAVALFSTWLIWNGRRRPGILSRLNEGSLWLTIALPGIVMGVALLSAVFAIPGLSRLYGTIWLLLVGLFVAAVPVAIRAAEGSVKQIGMELYEASRTVGAGNLRATIGIVFRLLIPAIGSTWFIAAVLITGNVAVPVLLSTPAVSVVAVEALWEYREGRPQIAAAIIATIIIIWGLIALMLGLYRAWSRNREAHRVRSNQEGS